jgi:hypothetical protein
MRKIKITFCFFLAFLSNEQILACGGDGYYDDVFATIFSQQMVGDSSLHQFLYEPYATFFNSEYKGNSENITAWKTLFAKNISEDHVQELVFESELNDIIALKEKRTLDERWRNNTLAKAFYRGEYNNALTYLLYAKKCEVLANRRSEYSWENDTYTYDTTNFQSTLNEGLKLLKLETNIELKTRYGFQVVRLAHYSDQFALAVSLFEKHLQPIASNGYIYFRALEQYAGALNGIGEMNKAAYLFTRVFDRLKDRRENCMLSFKFTENSFDATLEMCATPHEKAVLYAMRGYDESGYPLEEMENIWKVDPNSTYLELFLARQMKMYEMAIVSTSPTWGETEKEPYFSKAYLDYESYNDTIDIQRFSNLVFEVRSKCNNDRKDFWTISYAYIFFLRGSFDACIAELDAVKSIHFKEQKRLIRFMATLLKQENISPEFENYIVKEEYLNSALNQFLLYILRTKYYNQGDLAKAFLCHDDINTLRDNLNLNMIDILEKYLTIAPKSEMDKLLQSKISGDDLNESRGTYYFRQNDLTKAIKYYTKASQAGNSLENGFIDKHLFRFAIHHIFAEDFESQSHDSYVSENCSNENESFYFSTNLLSLATAMFKMDSLALQLEKKNPAKAAKLYFSLAAAWNNMSPYGYHRPILYYGYGDNCCNAYIYNVSHEDNYNEDFSFRTYCNNSQKIYQPKIAITYLKKALPLSTDKELKAQIIFKLAEAELYSSYGYDGEGFSLESSSDWYAELQQYKKTKYYKEVIKECGYFSNYVSKNL